MILPLHVLTFLKARDPHEVECERCGRGWPTIAAWAAEKTSDCPGDLKLAGVVAALEGPEWLGRERRRELAEALRGAVATGAAIVGVVLVLVLAAGCKPWPRTAATPTRCDPERPMARTLIAQSWQP